MDVTGRDLVRYFKRPILPNTTPIPFIRYSRELTQSVDDIEQRDRLEKRVDWQSTLPPNQVEEEVPKISKAVVSVCQTDFRDSEAQTDPCTLDYVYDYKDILPEVSAVELLTYGRGLPVKTLADREIIDRMRIAKRQQDRLPTVGDPQRSLAQRRLVENQYEIDLALRSRSSHRRRTARNQQMKYAVQEFAETSALLLQEKLDRMWQHKQQEKEIRMTKIRKIHSKEIKALERKCFIKNERLRSNVLGGRFQTLDSVHQGKEIAETTRRPTKSSRGRKLDDDFLNEYNNLRCLERETSKHLSTFFDDVMKDSNLPLKIKDGYVRRGDRYNYLLNSAYEDMQKKRDQVFVEEERRPETPEILSDEDEGDFMQRHAEEILKASLANKGRKNGNDSSWQFSDGFEEDETVPRVKSDEEIKVEREAQIEAFLDQIEGETLGEMMNYLSAELGSSTLHRFATDQEKAKLEEENRIYDEMTRLTRSTVDRYLDKIILDILYKSAMAVAEKETEEQLSNPKNRLRRSSASELETSSRSSSQKMTSTSLEILKRLKELQKNHLMQAHDALWAVLEEVKEKKQAKKRDRNLVEEDIREALTSICNPEEVEKELRLAMSTLDLDSSSKED